MRMTQTFDQNAIKPGHQKAAAGIATQNRNNRCSSHDQRHNIRRVSCQALIILGAGWAHVDHRPMTNQIKACHNQSRTQQGVSSRNNPSSTQRITLIDKSKAVALLCRYCLITPGIRCSFLQSLADSLVGWTTCVVVTSVRNGRFLLCSLSAQGLSIAAMPILIRQLPFLRRARGYSSPNAKPMLVIWSSIKGFLKLSEPCRRF